MSAVMPSTTRQQHTAAHWDAFRRPEQHPRHTWRIFLHPLTAICAVQVGLSLTFVWSNTAFSDEADYLRIGHLEISHWLHGTIWPSEYADRILSGSPLVYPPLGALADSIGGLSGARILSLVFMIGSTVLLYLTASRLIGRRGAVSATALWALSEPAIRLAFATYDPLSIFLTALSAWFVVQAGHRHRWASVAAAAAALALANATAYSGIVVDPVVIAFAFLAWLPRMRALQALLRTAALAGGSAIFYGLLMTASRSWAGLLFTVVARKIADYQDVTVILNEILQFTGLIIVLAVVGSIVAVNNESKQRAALLTVLGCASFMVPAAQLHDQTAWSLDKHLAYGIWFAAITAGYGCDQLIRSLPEARRQLAAICCVIALAYLAANSWQTAWQRYHAWPNASAFISAFKPAAARASGLIFVPGHQVNIAEYYTPEGSDWRRWSSELSLDPVALPQKAWGPYYTEQLRGGNYGMIVLFYSTTFSSAPELPDGLLLSRPGRNTDQRLLGLVGNNSGEPGLRALTLALENDPDYYRVTIGPYNSTHEYGIFAIWQKVPS